MTHHDEAVGSLLEDIPQSANVLGRVDAPITLEYFGDLQCPFCRDFSLGVLPAIIQRWVRTGTLRVEYRALETATGDPDVFVAQQVAVLAAGKQAKAARTSSGMMGADAPRFPNQKQLTCAVTCSRPITLRSLFTRSALPGSGYSSLTMHRR